MESFGAKPETTRWRTLKKSALRAPLRAAKKIDVGAAADSRQPPRCNQQLTARKKSLYALKTSGFTRALLRR